jgi:adenosylcobinamide-GDP ribazoletransferase
MIKRLNCLIAEMIDSLLAALAFYTIVPLPPTWQLNFQRIARFAPFIGVLIGGILGMLDWALLLLKMPVLTRSAVVVAAWVWLTGGLHLDGAMDTADGLATLEDDRRLQIMRDSRVGAFGAIAAIIILLLKTVALSDLSQERWLILIIAAAWGRWGQIVAISLYPYLRETGKGLLHKRDVQTIPDILTGLLPLLGCIGLQIWLFPERWWDAMIVGLGGMSIALSIGFWIDRRLGGHTGDTYGATVEWTEVGILLLATFAIY